MSHFIELEKAILKLNKSVYDFPLGAISLDDFEPIEETIIKTRSLLTQLNARIITQRARNYARLPTLTTPLTEDSNRIERRMLDATTRALISKKAIHLCLHSHAIQAILSGKEGDENFQDAIYTHMHKLFSVNDEMLTLQESIEKAFEKRLNLHIECQRAIFEYDIFLKEQEDLRNRKLEETNPKVAKIKQQMHQNLQKMNLTKKLITSMIATSGHLLKKLPSLVNMLENHRELITMETISAMSQTST